VAWEQRGNQQYYYRSHRIGRRVVKEYVGPGLRGEMVARSDADKRGERAARRAAEGAQHAADDRLLTALGQLAAAVDAVVAQALRDNGYHQHRGQWRQRRGG
jgi:hypothetical protein